MDSKTRNELEQNELAKWLTNQYEDWIEPNKSWLGYAVLGILIVVVIIFATARVNEWNRKSAWQQYFVALRSVDANAELKALADSTAGAVGAHARLALAQLQLSEGSAQAFIDKSAAILLLEESISSFRQVQGETRDPLLLQQAGFGLGQCRETLAAVRVGDDLAQAEEEYQRVAERWADGFMGQRAQKQLALIRQQATRMFLERMEAQVPEIPTGMEGFGFGGVSFDPDEPVFPGGFDLGDIFGQTPAAETPTEEAPEEDPLEEEPAQ